MAEQETTPDAPAHEPGTSRGEAQKEKLGAEGGRDDEDKGRTARDSTTINPDMEEPIDPRMPDMPPA